MAREPDRPEIFVDFNRRYMLGPSDDRELFMVSMTDIEHLPIGSEITADDLDQVRLPGWIVVKHYSERWGLVQLIPTVERGTGPFLVECFVWPAPMASEELV